MTARFFSLDVNPLTLPPKGALSLDLDPHLLLPTIYNRKIKKLSIILLSKILGVKEIFRGF
jgi:hypothetical protein